MITGAVLRAIAPVCREPDAWAIHLHAAALKYGIDTPGEAAEWLAQLAHESAGYNRLVENLNYSAAGLMATWPRRFPNLTIASTFARNPEKIANYVYSNRMGNGPVSEGNGWRYRGRGLIQLTGLQNYMAAAVGAGLPLVLRPELLAESKAVSANVAAWFWEMHGLNAETDDIEDDTRTINGGLTGLVDRKGYWTRAKKALGVA